MTQTKAIPTDYSPDWLEKLDGRTRMAQVINSRYHQLTTDLGGVDALSYQQRSLCKRALWFEAMLEQWEAALSRGEEVDPGKLTNTTNTLIGLYKALGLNRQSREVSLSDLINRSQGE
jgi:hypothetical protein